MIRVNLLATTTPGIKAPRVWLPPEHRSAMLGLGMLVLTAVTVGGWWWSLDTERASVDLKIANAEAEIERLKGVAKLVEYATARKAELAERLNLIQHLRATEREPVTLLETVNRSVPDGLWLLDIKQAGKTVQVEGQAMSITYVTDFAEHLQDSGFFQKPVEISKVKTETVQDASVIRFVLKAGAVDHEPAAVAGTPAVHADAKTGASGG
jgi:Tfp pilus assembly protein PilN